MPESTLMVLLLAIVLAAIAFVLRTLQPIQATLATSPPPSSTGLASVPSEQARFAHELGRTTKAIGVLQSTSSSQASPHERFLMNRFP